MAIIQRVFARSLSIFGPPRWKSSNTNGCKTIWFIGNNCAPSMHYPKCIKLQWIATTFPFEWFTLALHNVLFAYSLVQLAPRFLFQNKSHRQPCSLHTYHTHIYTQCTKHIYEYKYFCIYTNNVAVDVCTANK